MNSDHIASWREYLVGQMHEQRGVAKPDAQKTVDQWLGSRGEHPTSDIAEGSTEETREG
jgi:hypothetical protein